MIYVYVPLSHIEFNMLPKIHTDPLVKRSYAARRVCVGGVLSCGVIVELEAEQVKARSPDMLAVPQIPFLFRELLWTIQYQSRVVCPRTSILRMFPLEARLRTWINRHAATLCGTKTHSRTRIVLFQGRKVSQPMKAIILLVRAWTSVSQRSVCESSLFHRKCAFFIL